MRDVRESGALADAVEKLRNKRYVVGRDTQFDLRTADDRALLHTHGALYNALAYLDSHVCDVDDARNALDAYERSLLSSTTTPVNALYLLARARLAAKLGELTLNVLLLVEFSERFASLAASWLRDDEKAVTTSATLPVAEVAPTKRSVDDRARDDWCQLEGKLSDAQRKPMEKLLKQVKKKYHQSVSFEFH